MLTDGRVGLKGGESNTYATMFQSNDEGKMTCLRRDRWDDLHDINEENHLKYFTSGKNHQGLQKSA